MAIQSPAPARFSDTSALSSRARAMVFTAIAVLHALAALVLIAAFGGAHALTGGSAPNRVLVATVLRDPVAPRPRARTRLKQPAQGASGAQGRRAAADQIIAAPVVVPIVTPTAPPVAGLGSETRSGAGPTGAGSGGAATGIGTGNGENGNGAGAHGPKTRPVKIAGDLAEGDYPRAGRKARLGTAVVIVLTVGTTGQVTDCRIDQPSGDPQADAVTCKLATLRFRFRPATDQNGDPVVARYGWQQRFFWN